MKMTFVVGGVLLGLCVVGTRSAEACGGFFCQNVPVDQSGEHLLFGIEDDGTVVAHIQIQYQGAAESFAWVLPLPSEPEVSVGSDEIFRTLRNLTDPQFYLRWNDRGECKEADQDYGSDADSDADADGDADGEVTVLQQGPVGPYERAVLQADDAQELLTWLEDNDYQIPAVSLPEIESYVNGDFVFLALRLQKDRSVGDLVPVVVRFEEVGPCIPLRLTSIAASPDMPIYAWVLADGRAVSTNFLDVEPNWAAIDWLRNGSNYEDVVRRAVDEATGHSFVTEYAGRASVLDGAFWWVGRYDLDAVRTLEDPAEFVQELISQGFSATSALLGLLQQFIPKPAELEDVSEQDFYNCLECYSDALVGLEFDPGAFADAIEEVIVGPLVEAQAMAGRHPYLTRLHTTISPEEMTEDPIFRFNLDLGDVSNVHQAEAETQCDPNHYRWEAPVRLTLPDGQVMFIDPGDPAPSTLEDMPASSRATQMGETGPGDSVYDNGEAIAGAIDAHFGRPLPDDGSVDSDGDGIPDVDEDDIPDGRGGVAGGGCTVAGTRRGAVAIGLLVAVAAILRRRRAS
jgi:hypothetical protein